MRLFPKPTVFLDLAKTMIASCNEFASGISDDLCAVFGRIHRESDGIKAYGGRGKRFLWMSNWV